MTVRTTNIVTRNKKHSNVVFLNTPKLYRRKGIRDFYQRTSPKDHAFFVRPDHATRLENQVHNRKRKSTSTKYSAGLRCLPFYREGYQISTICSLTNRGQMRRNSYRFNLVQPSQLSQSESSSQSH